MKSRFILLLAFYCYSCSNIDHRDHDLVVSLKQGVDQSSLLIIEKTKTLYESLQEKLYDPVTRQRALIWEPKAEKAKILTDDFVRFVDSLKDAVYNESGLNKNPSDKDREDNTNATNIVFCKNGKEQDLNAKLEGYKEKILAIDQGINRDLKEDIDKIILPFHKEEKEKNGYNDLLKDKSNIMSLLILSSIQNRVRVIESKIVNYCYNYSGPGCILRFDKFSAIVAQSSNILKPGDELTINAGVGSFTRAAAPAISVNGRQLNMNNNDMITYKLKAAAKPGKYIIPVKIEYTNQEGLKERKVYSITYTVFDTTKH